MKPLTALLITAGLFALVACGDSGEGGDTDITLAEWSIAADPDSVPEGPVEFNIENTGEREHELVIVETETPVDDLPTNDDGSFDEDAPGVDVVREIEDIGEGDDTSRTYDLDAGSYALLCNIVEDIDDVETAHFQQGMRTAFTVTEEE